MDSDLQTKEQLDTFFHGDLQAQLENQDHG